MEQKRKRLEAALKSGPACDIPGLVYSLTAALKFCGMDSNTWSYIVSHDVCMKHLEAVLASIASMKISTPWAGVFSAVVEYRESVARMRGALATLAQQKEFAYFLSEHCVKDAQCTTRSKQFVEWIEVLYGCI